jgi:hypothetical protein
MKLKGLWPVRRHDLFGCLNSSIPAHPVCLTSRVINNDPDPAVIATAENTPRPRVQGFNHIRILRIGNFPAFLLGCALSDIDRL